MTPCQRGFSGTPRDYLGQLNRVRTIQMKLPPCCCGFITPVNIVATGKLYTVMIIDASLDIIAPAQFFHWIVNNIPGDGDGDCQQRHTKCDI